MATWYGTTNFEDPAISKIRKTVNWYNKNGNLKKPLYYKDVAEPLLSLGLGGAMKVLAGLETKGSELDSPTAWVLGFVAKLGGGDYFQNPIQEEKVGKTVSWYNKHGELPGKLYYREVAGPLSRLSQTDAMKVLKELDDKKAEVKDPTRWTVGYARFLERSAKVKRTCWWHNKNSSLKAQIQVNEVVGSLAAIDDWQAMSLLKDLAKRKDEINDPTAWLCKAAQKKRLQSKEKYGKADAPGNESL